MSRKQANGRSSLRGFIILTLIVVIGAALLWSQGDLSSPVQSTSMLIGMASGDADFAMVGDREAPPDSADAAVAESSSDTTAADSAVSVEVTAPEESETTAATMTMDEFTAALAAAGVDVEATAATMSAEGRSLDNLLAVVNSGRTTVEELAARLNGTNSATIEVQPESEGGSTSGLLDIRWDEIGSVAYDLWFMLAVTVVVIIVGRPVGWLINQIKRTPRTSNA